MYPASPVKGDHRHVCRLAEDRKHPAEAPSHYCLRSRLIRAKAEEQYLRPLMASPLLFHPGDDTHATWRSMTWTERQAALFSSLKKNAPTWVRETYHRRAAQMLQIRMAPFHDVLRRRD